MAGKSSTLVSVATSVRVSPIAVFKKGTDLVHMKGFVRRARNVRGVDNLMCRERACKRW